jgi:hypothetical protein
MVSARRTTSLGCVTGMIEICKASQVASEGTFQSVRKGISSLQRIVAFFVHSHGKDASEAAKAIGEPPYLPPRVDRWVFLVIPRTYKASKQFYSSRFHGIIVIPIPSARSCETPFADCVLARPITVGKSPCISPPYRAGLLAQSI